MALVALILTACGAGVVLPEGVAQALDARADAYEAQFPGEVDWNIARICLDKPEALYWNDAIQTYAVACVIKAFPDTYGIVLVDVNGVVLNTEHISAKSLTGLEELIRGLGWVRQQ